MDLSGSVCHRCQCSKCCLFCSSLERVSFTPVGLKSIFNLKVESYQEFEGFKPGRPHLKLRNLGFLYLWEEASIWALWNNSFVMHHSYLGPVSSIFTSWVSSGLTTRNGCSLMAARWQVVFSFMSFLRVQWLTLQGCNSQWVILSSKSGIWPILGRHFMIKLCPTVLGGSSQVRKKFLICPSRC